MLELTAAALDPSHARATNEQLMAVKAWPAFNQAKKRDECREAFGVDRAIAEAEAVGGSPPPGLLRRAQKATDLDALRVEFVQQRCRNGFLVGEYYWNALEASLRGAQFTAAELKYAQTRPARGRLHPVLKINTSKMRDIEREYRPAAHLWCAHFLMKFEFEPPNLPEYLALSELIADHLLTIHLKQHGPLLDPRTPLWRVPAQLRALLPPISLAVEQVQPGTKLLDLIPLPPSVTQT